MRTEAQGPEARKHPRAEVGASAIVVTATAYLGTYRVRNLSMGGALLAGRSLLLVGERIGILFRIKGVEAMSVPADVLRADRRESGDQLFAAAFRDLSPAAESAIGRIVGEAATPG
jgi:PilZ domain